MNLKDLFRKKNIVDLIEEASFEDAEHHRLKKVLTVKDLTALGIAAVIGAGIFSTIGKACFDGGPGVVLLFVIVAIACGFSAFCYAELASRIPVAGSAYTYSYATFGELIAWIIGWDLIIEYAIGNITVAIAWSANFSNFLNNLGISIPAFLTNSWMSVCNGEKMFSELARLGKPIPENLISLHHLWISAPRIGSIPVILNLPAFIITAVITYLVYIGIKESRTAGNLFVLFKLLVISLVIIVGIFYINPENWTPFAPNGFQGIMKGVSAVFFAYIGFDAISTTAEECRNPRRDLPRGMFYSLLICTVLYILIALVLTGMVNYTKLNVPDFLASVFQQKGLNWLGGLIALSAVIATAGVLLVFQLGQPRIWMSMSRDGLLPPVFSKTHKKYKTPSFATLVTGFVVGVPSLFLDDVFVTDLCSIGTLFAFILVCGGILVLPQREKINDGRFHLPYINGRYIVPLIFLGVVLFLSLYKMNFWNDFFSLDKKVSFWMALRDKTPYYIFFLLTLVITFFSYRKHWSLIPVLGLSSCLYLMTELGITNWERFIIWLIVGLVIYFFYGRKRSLLNTSPKHV